MEIMEDVNASLFYLSIFLEESSIKGTAAPNVVLAPIRSVLAGWTSVPKAVPVSPASNTINSF